MIWILTPRRNKLVTIHPLSREERGRDVEMREGELGRRKRRMLLTVNGRVDHGVVVLESDP